MSNHKNRKNPCIINVNQKHRDLCPYKINADNVMPEFKFFKVDSAEK